MRFRSNSLFLFVFLTLLQAAQGFFPGASLCREENGEVTLEWSRDGQCAAPGASEVECLQAEDRSPEHCDPCFDVPLPEETSLRSAATTPDLFVADLAEGLETPVVELSRAPFAPASLPGSPLAGRLASVRLLI